MPSLGEALASQATPLQAALDQGLDTLSKDQDVIFTKYVRLVLPVDGYVFWVPASEASPGAIYNAAAINAFAYNETPTKAPPAPTKIVRGSLHHAVDNRQELTNSSTTNRLIFTAQTEVDNLNDIGPATLYFAEVDGIPYAFSQRGRFYEQAKLWHYSGDAVFSELATQVVKDVTSFDASNYVASNSLPLWLMLNSYVPPYPAVPVYPSITLFPAMLVPSNLKPPYGVVDVQETTAIQSFATIHPYTSTTLQLVRDRVRVTLTGLRNITAEDWLRSVVRTSRDEDMFGIMNQPVISDDKRGQVEIGALAQKKHVDFEVSYYQNRANNVAQQLILEAFVRYLPQEVTAPLYFGNPP